MKTPKKGTDKDIMLDPKHLIAQVVNETVKWIVIGLLIAFCIGALGGGILALYFK